MPGWKLIGQETFDYIARKRGVTDDRQTDNGVYRAARSQLKIGVGELWPITVLSLINAPGTETKLGARLLCALKRKSVFHGRGAVIKPCDIGEN